MLSSTWAPKKKNQDIIPYNLIAELWTRPADRKECVISLTRQTEARLVKVTHWLLSDLLLLLLLLGRGGLQRGDGGHRLWGQSHLTHRPIILAPGDSLQLCELNIHASSLDKKPCVLHQRPIL